MSINSLYFCVSAGIAIGQCLLCDKNISRNKFKNISQVNTGEYKLVLLSQIFPSQIEINSVVKNRKNEKVSIISNIYQMSQETWKWNSNFDVVSINKNPN
jgi:hypothetical protein